ASTRVLHLLRPRPSPAPLRARHAFPTRRSSDLLPKGAAGTPLPFRRRSPGCPKRTDAATCFSELAKIEIPQVGASKPAKGTEARSEEHTSELQSRFDLVCRLLLEKKKMNTSQRK